LEIGLELRKWQPIEKPKIQKMKRWGIGLKAQSYCELFHHHLFVKQDNFMSKKFDVLNLKLELEIFLKRQNELN
jgi:hypothetical protein